MEDTESVDSTTIPVLIITIPDKYQEGKILYKGTFIDLKTLLLTNTIAKPVNFFVVPKVLGLQLDSITASRHGDHSWRRLRLQSP
jgi:hypothetical protein